MSLEKIVEKIHDSWYPAVLTVLGGAATYNFLANQNDKEVFGAVLCGTLYATVIRAIQVMKERSRHGIYEHKKDQDKALQGKIGTKADRLETVQAKINVGEIHISEGLLALNQRDYERAIQEFKTAQRLDDTNIQTYVGLSRAYTSLGKNNVAVLVAEQGLKHCCRAGVGYFELREIYERLTKSTYKEPSINF